MRYECSLTKIVLEYKLGRLSALLVVNNAPPMRLDNGAPENSLAESLMLRWPSGDLWFCCTQGD